MRKITLRLLTEEGFHEYNNYLRDSAQRCFEKEYILPKGVYFLSVKYYDVVYDYGRLVSPEHFEISAKLFKKCTHERFRLIFESEDLDEANEFIANLFEKDIVESCRLEAQ